MVISTLTEQRRLSGGTFQPVSLHRSFTEAPDRRRVFILSSLTHLVVIQMSGFLLKIKFNNNAYGGVVVELMYDLLKNVQPCSCIKGRFILYASYASVSYIRLCKACVQYELGPS